MNEKINFRIYHGLINENGSFDVFCCVTHVPLVSIVIITTEHIRHVLLPATLGRELVEAARVAASVVRFGSSLKYNVWMLLLKDRSLHVVHPPTFGCDKIALET